MSQVFNKVFYTGWLELLNSLPCLRPSRFVLVYSFITVPPSSLLYSVSLMESHPIYAHFSIKLKIQEDFSVDIWSSFYVYSFLSLVFHLANYSHFSLQFWFISPQLKYQAMLGLTSPALGSCIKLQREYWSDHESQLTFLPSLRKQSLFYFLTKIKGLSFCILFICLVVFIRRANPILVIL